MMSSGEPDAQQQLSGGRWTLGVAVMVLAVGFLLLLTLPIGYLGVVFIGLALLFGSVSLLHYLVWGRWMTRVLQASDGERFDSPSEDTRTSPEKTVE